MTNKKNGSGARRPQDHQVAHQGSVVTEVYHRPTNGSSGDASPCRTGRQSELHEVGFPARLVMSRWNDRTGEPFACADTRTLWSDVDVGRRLEMYGGLEAAGMIPYWWMVVEDHEAERIAASLLSEDECDYYDALYERQAVQLGVG